VVKRFQTLTVLENVMSKIAIIGATGRAGSQLLEEALRRGHSVTAIARNTDKLAVRPGVSVKQVDALDAEALQQAISGSDVVISAAHFATPARQRGDRPGEKSRGQTPAGGGRRGVRCCCRAALG
jgi:nucleoside-diphosphate-sugar epimerase